jgi:hypothetical protein
MRKFQEDTLHTARFFPIGNADSCLIELENGRRALFDFADMRNASDSDDRRCDLEKELRDCLGDAKEIDVVAFTHFDKDHCHRAKEVFHLDHAEKYQSGDRIKIKTMWVPANAILEEGVKGQARTLRAEARHRFIEGKGIRVFSRPDKLDDFLRDRGIDPDGLQVFVHSPFAMRQNGQLIDRNDSAIFVQATFRSGGRDTKLILSADVAYSVIEDIVKVTKYHDNESRLEWDVNNIPHHSSYLSLSDDKGALATVPVDDVKWLYEEQGQAGGIIVSTSCPIPDGDTTQPPHRQAAAYYRDVAKKADGQYIVTMENPTISKPKPLVIEFGGTGAKIRKTAGGAPAVVGAAAPRAG